MKIFLLTICFLSVQTGMVAIAQDKKQTPVSLDDAQPIEVRVQDALNRMTVEEKTRLSYAQGKFSSPGCPRLGIPELWMSDGPHGVRAEINWNDWGYAGWTNDSCTAFPALTVWQLVGIRYWQRNMDMPSVKKPVIVKRMFCWDRV